jgi:PAS domain S-box-containing protein
MVSQMLGVGVFAIGGLALLGWALNIALLKSLVFDSPAISPLTALCLLFFGFSLWSFARDTDVGVRWQAPQFCAFAVGLIGLFKLADYLLGWNVNFDGLGFGGQLAQRMPSKNMSFVSALNCFLLGGALLFAGSRRNFVAFQTLILFAGSISWLGCLHYFYGGKPLAPLEATSFLSSIAFVLLAIGLFCTRTDRGLMALFLSDSAGGLLVRRLLLPALAIPFIIGWLGQKMQEAGWFGPEAGIALFGLSNAVLFAALIWRNAALLHHADSERRSTAAQLDDSYKEIKDLKSALDEHAIVAITNPQGKITYVNDKFCAISKYSRAELMGQDHRLINSGYHRKEFIRDLWMTIAAGRVWQGEIKNRAQDGSFYWVATTIVPQVGHDGKPRQYVAIREDITQRKHAEEALARLAAIVNSSDDAIIGKTLNGVITSWNAAAEKMLGYSSREAIGQPLTIIFPPERVPEEIDFLARIARGESIKNYETIRVRKDGRRLDVSVTISPIEDASGKIVGASKIMMTLLSGSGLRNSCAIMNTCCGCLSSMRPPRSRCSIAK